MKPILFPNLGLSLDINSIAFQIGEKPIYWYGIIITTGILLALTLAWFNRKNQKINWDDITDFVLLAIPIGIICARLYYVIFKWEYYSNHLIEIFQIWKRWHCNIRWHHRRNSNSSNILQNQKNQLSRTLRLLRPVFSTLPKHRKMG